MPQDNRTPAQGALALLQLTNSALRETIIAAERGHVFVPLSVYEAARTLERWADELTEDRS